MRHYSIPMSEVDIEIVEAALNDFDKSKLHPVDAERVERIKVNMQLVVNIQNGTVRLMQM